MRRVVFAFFAIAIALVMAGSHLDTFALKARPISPVSPDGTAAAYSGPSGAAVGSLLSDLRGQFEHYDDQAKDYDNALLALRVTVLLCSVAAAFVLAISSGEWSRRTALVLSVLAAAVPATDQIFQVSDLQRVSWRTAVDVSRLYATCKDAWETASLPETPGERLAIARSLATTCRSGLTQIVDKEMDVSLKPLQLPGKIGVK